MNWCTGIQNSFFDVDSLLWLPQNTSCWKDLELLCNKTSDHYCCYSNMDASINYMCENHKMQIIFKARTNNYGHTSWWVLSYYTLTRQLFYTSLAALKVSVLEMVPTALLWCDMLPSKLPKSVTSSMFSATDFSLSQQYTFFPTKGHEHNWIFMIRPKPFIDQKGL